MAAPVNITVRVSKDKSIHYLKALIESITELHDLVPEWSRLEADKELEGIWNRLNDLIEVVEE